MFTLAVSVARDRLEVEEKERELEPGGLEVEAGQQSPRDAQFRRQSLHNLQIKVKVIFDYSFKN